MTPADQERLKALEADYVEANNAWRKHAHTRPVEPAWCGCGHAKRTHTRGWYACRVNACACQRYAQSESRRADWLKAYESWQEIDKPLRATRDEAFTRYYTLRNADSAKAAATAQAAREAAYAQAASAAYDGAVDVARFRSFSAYLDGAQVTPINAHNRARWSKIKEGALEESSAWYVADTDCPVPLNDCAAWLMRGWPEGVTRMRATLGDLKMPALSDVRRRGVWSDIGDTLSLDRLYAGDVERCWRTTKRARAGAPPRLQIIAHCVMNGSYKGDDMFWKGAAAALLAEGATAAGYSVAIDVVQGAKAYTRGNAAHIFQVRVKDYDAPLNLASAVAMTAHPATLRILMFAMQDTQAVDDGAYGRGSAWDPNEATLRAHDCLDFKSVPIIVPGNILSCEKARAWIAQTVAKLESLGAEESA